MAVGLAASPALAQVGYPEFPADASLLRGESGFAMTTLPRDSRLGRSIAAAGDINNDGIDDFAVTALDGR
ncbi:MAG: FG-GAP repeat protein, partial [Phycisphaerales bacterium]|nr:FG-GAP repeat protein [Phycisphaerales bacterium]